MKVILVTGGAGFIGSNFLKYFLQRYKDYLVINYDKLTYAGNLLNIRELEGSPNYYFEQGDICDSIYVNEMIKKYDPDYVINFAAESHVDRSIDNPLLFGQTNVMGTMNLLECLRKKWEKVDFVHRRFLQISTDEVYGSIDNDRDLFSEESNLMPNSPYSASKAGADLLVRAYSRTYGLPVIITRCCNNYGYNQNKEKFIPTCIFKALNNQPIPIYGDGTNRREWIHVLDHCAAIAKALFLGKTGEVYNIGSGEEVSNIEMAKMILRHLDKDSNALINVSDRPGHDWRYALDSFKIQNELDWSCSFRLREGIADTIKWYEDNLCYIDGE